MLARIFAGKANSPMEDHPLVRLFVIAMLITSVFSAWALLVEVGEDSDDPVAG